MAATKHEQRYRAMRRVSLVGAVVNLLLATGKIIFGFISQSHALIADGLHSFSDLVTDLMVWFAARKSNQQADQEHPYGHGRIETAFTVALGALLMLVALGIIIDAGQRLLTPGRLLHPTALALVVAFLSIVANEGLFVYTLRVARRVRSPLLRANTWHHRTDSISSVIVLIGVAGSLIGLAYLDAFAAVGVAVMIAKIGWDQAYEAVLELIDTGLEPQQLEAIRASIGQVEGVKDLHMLRTRRMGGEALVDVHIQVNPRLSVSEGHQIGEYVRNKLLEQIDEVIDVTVHIDPEDDESNHLCEGLPLRREIIARLREHWRSLIDVKLIQAINLHYLSGKIQVELILPLTIVDDPNDAGTLSTQLRQAVAAIDELRDVRVYFV
jgi:cation diffusion facilitator family transporter